MKDRVPTPGQEGRVRITPEGGGAAYYAKLEMADNPTQAGDEPIKTNLLPDAVATLLKLTQPNPQVKDALALIGDNLIMETVSYIGTGTVGADNPVSVTFGFAPILMVLCDSGGRVYQTPVNDSSYRWGSAIGVTSALSTSYATGLFMGRFYSLILQAKKSPDGKTISWYIPHTMESGSYPSAHYQYNTSGETYRVIAIGRR
jgi:hypothetical protein